MVKGVGGREVKKKPRSAKKMKLLSSASWREFTKGEGDEERRRGTGRRQIPHSGGGTESARGTSGRGGTGKMPSKHEKRKRVWGGEKPP